MEVISALRIELYNELQGLPEALRSEFPDLAVDFLATVFKAAPAAAATGGRPPQHQSASPRRPASTGAAGGVKRSTKPPPFQLLSPGAASRAGADAPSEGRLAEVQAMLEGVQQEAAGIDTTAGAMPAGGWGDLALPVLAAPPAQQQQWQQQRQAWAGGDAAPPAPAQLMECRRCHKVLLACSALQHQRQCSQQPEPAPSISQSEGRSSSEGLPAAPSGSRGSKRKQLSGGTVATVAGGGAHKQSRLSKGGGGACGGGSMRGGSVEPSHSMGEVVQGKLRPQQHLGLTLPRQHDPLSFFAAAEAAAASAPGASNGARLPQPLSPTVRLTQDQRRQRSQHPPRLKRQFLHTHPGLDLQQPLLLNAVAAPANGTRPASAPPSAAAHGNGGGQRMLPLQHLLMHAPANALPRPAVLEGHHHQQQQQPPQNSILPAPMPPAMAGQQPQQQQQQRYARYQEQCHIFESLSPEQQQRVRQLHQQRSQQRQRQQQQGVLSAGGPAQPGAGQQPGQLPLMQPAGPGAPRPVLSPQQLQLLHQNPAQFQQQLSLQQQQHLQQLKQLQQRVSLSGAAGLPMSAALLQQPPLHLGSVVPSPIGAHQTSPPAVAAPPGAGRSSPLHLPFPGSHVSPAGSVPRPPRPSPVVAFPVSKPQQQQPQPQPQQQQPLMHASQHHTGSPATQPLHRGGSPLLQQALIAPGLPMGMPLDSSSNGAGATSRGGGGLAGPAMQSHLAPGQAPQNALPVVLAAAPMAGFPAPAAAGGLPPPFQQHPLLSPLPMQFIPVPQPRAL